MTTMAGELFLNLVDQDQVWITRDGRRLALEETERSYRRNVLAMLDRHHKQLYREWLTEFLDESVTFYEFYELARLGWVARDPAIGRHRPVGARTWFERQPRVLRLRAPLSPPGGAPA